VVTPPSGTPAADPPSELAPARPEVPRTDLEVAEAFLQRFFGTPAARRSRLLKDTPLAAVQVAALTHPDAFARRGCLFFLDHWFNDASMEVFAAALQDPVDFVRNLALHSLACETCKSEQLCAADVVPGLVRLLESDPSPELRVKCLPLLMRLAGQDDRARAAVEHAAAADHDPIVRRAAEDAGAGRFVAPRKRYERDQRRHARAAGRAARP
jgi:hypothetical protein